MTTILLRKSSSQIEVEVYRVNREDGFVSGGKVHKLRDCAGVWSVWFRNGEPVRVDGIGRPHPKLVLAAAMEAWGNV